ncbi:YezD family protein [Altererythrobacter sp. Root672]|uniref:YezD family protein n=1 Tax=Altererythrobacter sp. Root672 TaxID=1736584 RepID=UPI0009E73441|nr:YezD family protein [Altererythrobacter sp. Root672]
MADALPAPASDDPAAPLDAVQLVTEALADLRFGTIVLTIHDGKLVQVDVTKRQRW